MKKIILIRIMLLIVFLLYNGFAYCQSTPCGPTGLTQPDYTKYLSGGRAYIKYGNAAKKILKPFIFVEALNPTSDDPDCAETNLRYGSIGWDIFTSGEDNRCVKEWDKIDLRYTPHLIRNLLTEGYDIIYLDFKEGAGDIMKNADVLIELIKYVNTSLDNNGSNSQNVVMGVSMGGVVSRIALTKMEKTGQNHNVRVWVSMDAPHNGANIPLGGQKMIEYFNSIDIVRNNMPDIVNANELLNMDAAKQMLIKHFGNTCHQMRTDMITSPYYSFPVNVPLTVAIANGSHSRDQGYSAGEKTVSLDFVIPPCLFRLEYDIWSLKDNTPGNVFWVRVGSPAPFCLGWLKVDEQSYSYNSQPYDNTSGGYRNAFNDFGLGNALHEKHSFIPTFSALSINTMDPKWKLSNSQVFSNYPYVSDAHKNICPFDMIYVPVENEQHVQSTFNNTNFIINAISPNQLYLQDSEIKGRYEARDAITAGFNVNSVNPNTGNVIVKANTSAELNATNKITLKKGFKVERNAKFKASKAFSSSCDEHNIPLLNNLKSAYSSTQNNTSSNEFMLRESEIKDNSILIYPNPFEDYVTVETEFGENIEYIIVYNILGEKLKHFNQINTTSYSLDLSDLKKGIYSVRIKTETSSYEKKITK